MPEIEIIQGDITQLKVDAIVNAANESLLGGGGVDGAILRAAGPELKVYNKTLGGCKTGEAKLSPGFNLPATYVISTVGPVWKGGKNNEEKLLTNCYKNSLKLATSNNIRTVAFPAISTGVYGYPFESATQTAIQTILEVLNQTQAIDKVLLVFFDAQQMAIAKSIFESKM